MTKGHGVVTVGDVRERRPRGPALIGALLLPLW
jgi:hypothetical protein